MGIGGDGMAECPCRYCTPPKRREGCHGACKEYIDWKADFDAQTQRRRQEEAADAILAEGAKNRKTRYAKGHYGIGVKFGWSE